MDKLLITISLFILVSGCAGKKIEFNKTYLKKNAQANFRSSRSNCYSAAKEVITDMGGEIKKEKAENFKFYTNQFSIDGDDSKMQKIYISVKGNTTECSVQFIKYKFWENKKAVKSLPEKFMKKKVFSPFFDQVFAKTSS